MAPPRYHNRRVLPGFSFWILNNNQVNLTTGGDPNLYCYGPGSGNDGTPGWGGAINPSGGANLVYTAASTGTYTLVCTTPTQNTQFQYPLMVMQMITFNNPSYTASSFPYTNNNVTLCSFNNYMFGEGGELFLDIYSVQLPPGLFTFTATMAPGPSGIQDIMMLLSDSNGNWVATATPNANGNYPLDSPATFQFTSTGGNLHALSPVLRSRRIAWVWWCRYQPQVYTLSIIPPPPGSTAMSIQSPAPIYSSSTTASVSVTVTAPNASDGTPDGECHGDSRRRQQSNREPH